MSEWIFGILPISTDDNGDMNIAIVFKLLEELLDIVVLTNGTEVVRVDGFRFVKDQDAPNETHPIFDLKRNDYLKPNEG